MCKPNVKIKKRDLEFMTPEQLNEVLQDELWFSEPRNGSEFAGQHAQNVITIRNYFSEKMRNSVNY